MSYTNSHNTCEHLIDKVIDNYRILEVIGRGGMGCVYRALDEKMGRVVALKIIRRNLGVYSLREGKALGQLNHPNIVNVFYMGESPDGVFIAMEYIEGETLTELIDRPWTEIVPAMKQTLMALEHAHQAGVIHRDIKPSNVMVTQFGQVKVMDFGIAKVESRDQDGTVTRIQAGTISYMSPEQVRGLQHVAHQSDIYSLGKTFYHILAGRLPFDARESDQYSILKAIIERQFKPPSHFNSALPRGLDRIIMRAIEKDPSARYQTAREMIGAIEEFEAKNNLAGAAPRIGAGAPASKRAFRPRQMALAAVMLVLVAATVVGVWYSTGRSSGDTVSDPQEQAGAATAAGEAPDRDPPPLTDRDSMPELPVASFASLQVNAVPSNSTVTLGDLPARSSPASFSDISPGTYNMRVEAKNYDPFQDRIELRPDTDTTIDVRLSPFGLLVVRSNVDGAQVQLNGRTIGSTPLNHSLSAGRYSLTIQAPGYQPRQIPVTIRAGESRDLSADLQRGGEQLRIAVVPEGTIFIDGQQRAENRSAPLVATVSEGIHLVRVTHPTYGTWQKQIAVREGTTDVTVDFTQEVDVRIGANVFGARIYVDGRPTRDETPYRGTLNVGLRRVEVRKDGYTSTPLFIEKLIEGNETDPVSFVFELTEEN